MGTQAGGRLECTATFVLPRGRIVTQGEVSYKGVAFTSVGAITGGTGIYRQARGEITIRAANLQEAKVVLNVTR